MAEQLSGLIRLHLPTQLARLDVPPAAAHEHATVLHDMALEVERMAAEWMNNTFLPPLVTATGCGAWDGGACRPAEAPAASSLDLVRNDTIFLFELFRTVGPNLQLDCRISYDGVSNACILLAAKC